jgi:23S rRNA (guanosine2251-2'-O)-methyltransferase
MELLYGKNPILEACRARRRKIREFYHAAEKADPELREVLGHCETSGIPARSVTRRWFEEKLSGALTQGWAALAEKYPYVPAEQILKSAADLPQATVLALDQVQDPQNLGALLRTAECAGVEGVLIPENRSSAVTPAVCKAAAGAEEYLEIARVTNLVRSLEAFKKQGFWIVGTAAPSAGIKPGSYVQDALNFAWPEKTLLVLGAEGGGMRRLTIDTCDFLIHLPLAGKITSLNVAAAGAVCLYERIRKKRI